MTRALASLSVALAVTGTGCMAGMMAGHAAHAPSAQATQTSEAAPGGTGGAMTHACPMAVPGTQVAAADTANGESITFTTSSDRAADLRARVRAMADMHNRHHAGGGMEGMHGGMQHGATRGDGHGGMMMGGGSMASSPRAGSDRMSMMPPPSRATVEDVAGGARIVVTPDVPADLDRLRSAIRMHADHMRESGKCDMGQPHKM